MTQAILVPAQRARAEIEIDRSRFIASASPAFTVEEARSFIQQIRHEFPDATHHVPGFLIGSGTSVIAHCSDDGEPSGTAGRPILVVLQGSGLGDIVVVVTRYYGGIKLGTGGLVKAYTQATQEVLKILPRAEKKWVTELQLISPYHLYDRIRLLLIHHHATQIHEEFAVDVTIQFLLDDEGVNDFNQSITQLSNGQMTTQTLDHRQDLVPILEGV